MNKNSKDKLQLYVFVKINQLIMNLMFAVHEQMRLPIERLKFHGNEVKWLFEFGQRNRKIKANCSLN